MAMWLFSNKTTVAESGLLEGFHDCHSHLLPGVDDGVGETDDTLQILHEWQSAGVTDVWLTPHIMEDYPNEPAELNKRFTALLKAYNGSVRLHLAAEHMMDGFFLQRLEKGDVMVLNRDGREMLLVETSYYIPPMNMQQIIDKIKEKGYLPLLAHPERYQYMGLNDYRHWRQDGVLMQLNLPSLVGAYGPEAQGKAEWLLNKDYYDYHGTDIHSVGQMNRFLSSPISRKTVRKIKNS